METINVIFKTKIEFEKDRNTLKLKKGRQVSQDEFLIHLIKCWRNSDN